MTDREFINHWSNIIREYLPKWEETLPIRTKDNEHLPLPFRTDNIERDIQHYIDWLERHENTVELWNFTYGAIPWRFKDFLTERKIIGSLY